MVPVPNLREFVGDDYAFEHVFESQRLAHMEQRGPVVQFLAALHNPDWSLRENFWGPSMLVEAAVNADLPGPDRIRLVNEATGYALAAYSGVENSGRDRLIRLGNRMGEAGMLGQTLEQTPDTQRVKASDPELSYQAAERLASRVRQESEVLFVPLSPGGIVASIQAALYYEQHSRNVGTGSLVYPVRFSPEADDEHPQIHPDELEALGRVSAGWMTIISVEDAERGGLQTALRFFRGHLGLNVIGLANNAGPGGEVAGTGRVRLNPT